MNNMTLFLKDLSITLSIMAWRITCRVFFTHDRWSDLINDSNIWHLYPDPYNLRYKCFFYFCPLSPFKRKMHCSRTLLIFICESRLFHSYKNLNCFFSSSLLLLFCIDSAIYILDSNSSKHHLYTKSLKKPAV